MTRPLSRLQQDILRATFDRATLPGDVLPHLPRHRVERALAILERRGFARRAFGGRWLTTADGMAELRYREGEGA
jgi:hypothetical protein